MFFFFGSLACRSTKDCILGGSAIGSRQNTSEVGRKAADELIYVLETKSCVDTYIQDQLIIFMALAKGISKVRCSLPLTLHTKTAIYIAELMTKVWWNLRETGVAIQLKNARWHFLFSHLQAKFHIVEQGNTGIIECHGINYENTRLHWMKKENK